MKTGRKMKLIGLGLAVLVGASAADAADCMTTFDASCLEVAGIHSQRLKAQDVRRMVEQGQHEELLGVLNNIAALSAVWG